MNKKVLVIGCTGTMGRALVDLWVQKGYETWGICRSHNVLNKAAHYLYGDATDEDFIKQVLESADYDAIADFMWYSPAAFEARIKALLNATKRYICLSSCAVYAHKNGRITETDIRFFDIPKELALGKDGKSHYHLEKAEIENIIQKQKKKNWTIIRPHVTMNDNHMPLNIWDDKIWLWRVAHGLPVVMYEDLSFPQSTYTMAIDVANMINRILSSNQSYGEVYNVVSDTILSGNELLEMFTRILKFKGISIEIVRVPNSQSFYQFDKLAAERITYDRAENRVFDNSKIKQLGNIGFGDFEKTLTSCVNMWLENMDKIDIVPFIKHHALCDRLSHSCGTIRYIHSLKQKKNYIIHRYPLLGQLYLAAIQPIIAQIKSYTTKKCSLS